MSTGIIAAIILVVFTHRPGFAEAGLSKRRAEMMAQREEGKRTARDPTHRAGPPESAQLPEPWMPRPAAPPRHAGPQSRFRVSAPLPDTHHCLSRVVGNLPAYKVVHARASCTGSAGPMFMAVLQKKDVVSYSIDTFRSWETEETRHMDQALAAGAAARGAENGTLLDIGANIGWYTVHMVLRTPPPLLSGIVLMVLVSRGTAAPHFGVLTS